MQLVHTDLKEFIGIVVLELEGVDETAFHTGVHLQHLLHLLFITGHNHNDVRIVVGQHAQQAFNNTVPIVGTVAMGVVTKAVRFIDEEHISFSLLQQVLHGVFRMTDVLADHIGTLGGDDLAFGQDTQLLEHLAHDAGDGGLAGTRIARKNHMLAVLVQGGQPLLYTQVVKLRAVKKRFQTALQRFQADHGIQFRQTFFHTVDRFFR